MASEILNRIDGTEQACDEKIAAAQHSLAADAAGFGEALRQMRERLIDLLAGLRGRK